jgi:dihydrolipoamide dehydrogenase
MQKKVAAAIIGAGTAGINAMAQIRKVTDDFVLINDGPLGTTCARVGCMPSKIMIQIGDDFHRRLSLAREGIGGGKRLSMEIGRSMDHLRELRDNFVGGIIEDVIKPLGERFIDGRAEFVEPNILKVGSQQIVADSVVIATGSRPLIPDSWEPFSDDLITSDTLFEQKQLPDSVAVIGLGLIGLELGQAMQRMGLDVTGFDQLAHIGGLQDPEVNRSALDIFMHEMPMLLGNQAEIEKPGPQLKISAGGRQFMVDKALVSIGRVPNTAGLQLANLGVDLDRNGVPVYDRHTMQVGDLPVFMAGDVSNHRPVLHEVAHEGTVAGYNAVHQPLRRFKRKAPLAVCFSDPNICAVGASWNEVKERDPAVGDAIFDGGREKIMLRTGGRIRLYADRVTGRLLGAEMAAPHGEHLAHLLAWSIQQDLTAFDLLAMPFYHPTVEETLKGALTDLIDSVENDPQPVTGFKTLD